MIDDPAFATWIAQLESDLDSLEWMTYRASTIYGESNEIQRIIIARLFLEL